MGLLLQCASYLTVCVTRMLQLSIYSSEAPRSLLLPFGVVFFSNYLLVGLILDDDNF